MTNSTTSGDTPNSPEASTYSVHITEELRRYDEHLRDVRGLASGTRKGRLRIIGWLLEGKFKHREIVFARMRPDDIRQFLARRLAKQRRSRRRAAVRPPSRYARAARQPRSISLWPKGDFAARLRVMYLESPVLLEQGESSTER